VFLPVFEADWIDAKFRGSGLSAQSPIEAGLTNMVSETVEILGIA
jgi:hypothetical protein